ncbi:uncharacterized protein LOC143300057 [Babylonia areolata]|uniref:uncharacterized protein LOC143300057 n=1 Tax=Babylonia areolata TaxID=304850 RepID=UPI003FCF6207
MRRRVCSRLLHQVQLKTPSSDVSSAAGSLTSNRSSSGPSSGEVTGGGGRGEAGQPAPCTPGPTTHNGAASSIVTITALREDLRKKDVEAQKAQSELYAKDGEVKFLKDSLHKQELELEKLRAEREAWKDAEEQRQKEREKELKQEVERLQTQVQFKSQDLLQLQQRCRTLENRLTHQQAPSPSESQQASTSTGGAVQSQAAPSPSKSPKVRKVEPRASRTPEKGAGAFPSYQSFMSPRVVPGGAQSVGTMTAEEGPECTQLGERRKERRQRRLQLQCSRGRTTGPRLVSQLLECSCSSSGEVEDSGIVGLLQMMPSRHDLMGLKYERDGVTARLSPVKKAKQPSSPGTPTCGRQPHSAFTHTLAHRPIVDRHHFLQALQGLRHLVEDTQLASSSSSSTTHPPQTGCPPPPPPPPRGAVLLLPMLNDYLQHYLDILSGGTLENSASSPSNNASSSNKSSSCETSGSSLESLTSSLGTLLQQGAEYANSVETLTLCALRVLNALVCACEGVRSLLVASSSRVAGIGVGVGVSAQLHPATAADTSSSTVETDQEKDEPSESGIEGDDEQSTASEKGSLYVSPKEPPRSPAVRLEDLNLLHKLLRLASPSQESSGFKVPVVEAALDVLCSLAVRLPEADMDRLHVVLLRGVVPDCLQLEHQPGITVRVLDLFSALVRSPALLPFLCTKADSCTLLSIHMVLTRLLATCRGKQHLQPLLLHVISKVMDSVSSVVSGHRHGVHILTDNNCRCSGQIIPSLVHSMFYLLRDYQLSLSDEVFGVLRKGILLLHEISLRDLNYQQRHGAVLPYYSTLMSGLTRVYKRRQDLPPVEVSALEDLWEELDESDSGSQDSDHEEPMATNS